MTASSFALIFLSVSMNAGAQIALRKGMLTLGAIPSISEPLAFLWTFARNVYLWGGLSFYAVSIFLLLGEAIPSMRLVGIALICVGVVCVSRTV
jgi:hypothetical protein